MWTIEQNTERSFTARFGAAHESAERFDPYEMVCVVEDMGDGVAVIKAATGGGKLPSRNDLAARLKALGFKTVRWVRVVEKEL